MKFAPNRGAVLGLAAVLFLLSSSRSEGSPDTLQGMKYGYDDRKTVSRYDYDGVGVSSEDIAARVAKNPEVRRSHKANSARLACDARVRFTYDVRSAAAGPQSRSPARHSYDGRLGNFLSRDSVGASSYLGSPNGMGPWSYANLNRTRHMETEQG